MSSDDCSICIDPMSVMKEVRLECDHRFHLHCMRKVLRFTQPRDDDEHPYLCPLCRAEIDLEMVDDITLEPRNLCFKYLLPRSVSQRQESHVRVVVSRQARSQRIKVGHLPIYHEAPSQRVLIMDFEFCVLDPREKFEVWVEDVETHNKLSRHYFVGTTATDHHSSDEEEMDLMGEPEPTFMLSELQQPRPTRRRRRVNPMAESERRRARLERRTISRASQIASARRALTRAQDIVVRREEQLQEAYDLFNESLNEFIEFRFPNEL